MNKSKQLNIGVLIYGVGHHQAAWLDDDSYINGFNLMPPTLPGSLEDFVDLVIPEMQKRGIFRKDYNGETFREMLELDK